MQSNHYCEVPGLRKQKVSNLRLWTWQSSNSQKRSPVKTVRWWRQNWEIKPLRWSSLYQICKPSCLGRRSRSGSISRISGSDSRDLVYNFGYFDGNNNRVFLFFNRPAPNLNTTIPILGNVTLFVQAALQNGIYSESTTVVRVYQGEPSKVTNVLTEQANDLSQTNGTAFESQLTTDRTSVV